MAKMTKSAKEPRSTNREVDVLGVITISRGCFERCCGNKKTPSYHSNLSFAAAAMKKTSHTKITESLPSSSLSSHRCLVHLVLARWEWAG